MRRMIAARPSGMNQKAAAGGGKFKAQIEKRVDDGIFVAPVSGKYVFRLYGAGGGGPHQNGTSGGGGSGGGGGGAAKRTVILNKGDALPYSVGAPVGFQGKANASTLTFPDSVQMIANSGDPGNTGSAGGTASGGDVNSTGGNGGPSDYSTAGTGQNGGGAGSQGAIGSGGYPWGGCGGCGGTGSDDWTKDLVAGNGLAVMTGTPPPLSNFPGGGANTYHMSGGGLLMVEYAIEDKT